jgi:fatty acid synthase
MDSMTAVEIKQSLEREFEIFLTPQEIRSLTFSRLREMAADNQDIEGREEPPQGTQLLELNESYL